MRIIPINFVPMIHRGEIVEKHVRESAYSITQLAKKLGKSRRHVYNLFENNKLGWDMIREIGILINHDFSAQFKELKRDHLKNIMQEDPASYGPKEQLAAAEKELKALKLKYIDLLEKYNELLSAQVKASKPPKKSKR